MYYPDIPKKWPMKVGSSLVQSKVIAFESFGFTLQGGQNIHTFAKSFEGIGSIDVRRADGPSIPLSSEP